MNDRQDPYGQIYGYDEYGRPLYRQAPEHEQQPGYDAHDPYGAPPGYGSQPLYSDPASYPAPPGYPGQQSYPDPTGYGTAQQYDGNYAYHPPAPGEPDSSGYPRQVPGHQQQPGGGYGYLEYDTGSQQPVTSPYPAPAAPPAGPGFDTYPDYDTGSQQPVPPGPEYDWGTGEQPPVGTQSATTGPDVTTAVPSGGVPAQRGAPADDEYQTEQFAFVEEPDEESEEVIDWLKFTESRTERREETKRRASSRRKLLIVSLVLAVIAGTGYLWSSGRLPFLPGAGAGEEAADVAESRDVIILHLRETGGDTNSTVLLVANEAAEISTTLLLPNELVITPDGGTTTLGQAVQEEGAASVREAVGTLLGAEIKGTWRLDTPYLENLVDLVGGVPVDADTDVPGDSDEEPSIQAGEQTLDGQNAVAYALYRADDEPQQAQLNRFGAVLAGVLRKLPETEDATHQVVENLAQVADPSLSEQQLGASLAQLAELARSTTHTTVLLDVEEDGTISDEVADSQVSEVLGGTVSNSDLDSNPRIAMRDASGSDTAAESVRISLVNGGFTVVDNKTADPREASEVRFSGEVYQETALEVARTLGIPEDSVSEGDTPGNADIAVIIGADQD